MNSAPEKTDEEQGAPSKGGKFPKGKSGNPKGRPKGSRNKASLAAEALLDGDAEAITKKAIQLAKAGDMAAIRLCLERLMPPRKCRPLKISLPAIKEPGDVLKVVNEILAAVASGVISTDEADALLRTVEAARRAMETEELHRGLDELNSRVELLNA